MNSDLTMRPGATLILTNNMVEASDLSETLEGCGLGPIHISRVPPMEDGACENVQEEDALLVGYRLVVFGLDASTALARLFLSTLSAHQTHLILIDESPDVDLGTPRAVLTRPFSSLDVEHALRLIGLLKKDA